ncbi:MAG: ABC transporter permease [Synergistaceae bacterium]|jgi:ribose/xylose/arabinose/galactoside ABC-type transport system permease subunit|nr:ABC transporter permease [Synergistaceae bacterium]
MPPRLKKFIRNPALGNTVPIVCLIGVLLAAAGTIAPGLLARSSLFNLLRLAAPLGIICIGQTAAILSGGVDLSVGSVAILTNVVAANILQGRDANNLEAFAVCAGQAVLIGLVNGLAVACVGINPFVMTLAMSIVIQGAALVYSGGAAGGAASPLVKFMGVGTTAGLPTAVVIWLVLSAVTLFVLHFTTPGRRLYATGANRKTARLSGVNVPATLVLVYVASALSSMAAGFVVTGNMGVGTLEWGFDYRLISMAAVIMGGTSFAGGQGGYAGSFVSAIALIVLNSLLTIVRVGEPVRQMIYGGVILISLWASTRKR